MAMAPHDIEEFNGELPLPQLLPPPSKTVLTRGRRIIQIVAGFLFGQGATQGVSVLASLFLIRTLSIEAYAQFSLAVGFQTVFTVLMDLGFTTTIIPLVGERRDDRALVGRYVRSAKHLRDRTFWFLAPIASVAFLAIMHKHHWSLGLQILLLSSVLLSLYSGGKVSYFSAPLFIFGRLREYYVPQVLSGVGRLLAYVGLALGGGLNAWTAAGLSALNITSNGRLIQKKSSKYLEWPAGEDPATDRELLRCILPATPAIIFSAFQSQISLFLVSIFGGILYIAQVAALGRIAQIFTVFLTFNTIVVEPYIARLSRDRLLRLYIVFVLLASAACVPVVFTAFRWPQIFLWVLGSKYEGMRDLLGWFVLSSCMNFVAGTMWIMNRGRKWLFWSGSILEVVLLLGVQISFLVLVGVKTTREAVMFGLASSFCYLIAHGYVATYGFLKGPPIMRVGPR
jgi:O-antigen/teichoic acid export membrane protein